MSHVTRVILVYD